MRNPHGNSLGLLLHSEGVGAWWVAVVVADAVVGAIDVAVVVAVDVAAAADGVAADVVVAVGVEVDETE